MIIARIYTCGLVNTADHRRRNRNSHSSHLSVSKWSPVPPSLSSIGNCVPCPETTLYETPSTFEMVMAYNERTEGPQLARPALVSSCVLSVMVTQVSTSKGSTSILTMFAFVGTKSSGVNGSSLKTVISSCAQPKSRYRSTQGYGARERKRYPLF
jgi:hypothetical protein